MNNQTKINWLRRCTLPLLPFVISLSAHSQSAAEQALGAEVKNQSLINSDGTAFIANSGYPNFSWDVTPPVFYVWRQT